MRRLSNWANHSHGCNDPLAGLGERLESSQMLARELRQRPLCHCADDSHRGVQGASRKGFPEANLAAEDIFAGELLVHYCPTIAQAIPRTLSQTLLDYGCGKGTLHTHGIVEEGKTVASSLSEYFKVRKATFMTRRRIVGGPPDAGLRRRYMHARTGIPFHRRRVCSGRRFRLCG